MRILVAATAVLAHGACFVPMSQGQAMQADMRMLRDRIVAVEDRAEADDAQLRARVAQAQRDAERIAETMKKVDGIARRADANFGEELVAVRRRVGQLQGRIETMEQAGQNTGAAEPKEDPIVMGLRNDVNAINQRLDGLEVQFKALQQALEAKSTVKTVVKAPPNNGHGKTETTPVKNGGGAVDESSRGLYRGGMNALRDGRYAEARQLLERWLSEYGSKADKASAVDDVHTAVGESYQRQKQYKKAVRSFQRVYKMGAGRADTWTRAVFRMGESFEALGDKAGARAFYKMAASKGSGGYKSKSAQRLKRLR